MSARTVHETILLVLDDDRDLLERLREAELVPRDPAALRPEHAEIARLVRTLLVELDVNWEGVEVILRLRAELMATRVQIRELLAVLRGDDHAGR
jgi:hypothetical protein